MSRRRWPGWVYSTGEEPDYRFSFANERTFLAWIRTAMALLAGAVALDVVDLSVPTQVQRALGAGLLVLGVGCALAAWLRWAAAERAIRNRAPLPSLGLAVVLVIGLVVAAVAVLVAGL